MADPAFEYAFSRFRSHLSPAEQNDFAQTTFSQVHQTIADIASRAASKKNGSRLRDNLSGFLQSMEQYAKVVEVFADNSSYSAYIWVWMSTSLYMGLLTIEFCAGPRQIHIDSNTSQSYGFLLISNDWY